MQSFKKGKERDKMEPKENIFPNAVWIDEKNLGIEKDNSKCINCGTCKLTCQKVTGKTFYDPKDCLSCGNCILTCPMNALKPKNELSQVRRALKENKLLIAYISPAVRVSIGECFGLTPGEFCAQKLIASLYKLGFSYVFDTTFGADLTIMEECYELKNRIVKGGTLPMITSCCPSWVKYAKLYYPELEENLSTCKSPIGMQGAMIKSYFAEKIGVKKDELFTVAITPCTAKKMETKEEQFQNTDAVLTVTELASWMKEEKLDLKKMEEKDFSSEFGEGSGGGTLFGSTGGVMTSALRTLYYMMTNEKIDESLLESLRETKRVKELELTIGQRTIKVAVVHGLTYAKPLLEEIKEKKSKYDFIEIMNCELGCVGGGGQPKLYEKEYLKASRQKGLQNRDRNQEIHAPYENENIKKIYQEFLISPGGYISLKYLHTKKKEEEKN